YSSTSCVPCGWGRIARLGLADIAYASFGCLYAWLRLKGVPATLAGAQLARSYR
ncbi:hypothetical protein TRAPUB_5440, partial [Trametes pubescens]